MLGNLLGPIPLVLEVDGFHVPVINFIWDCVKRHDLFYKQDGDSGSKEANEDIVVCDASMSGVALEGQDITLERWGELPILFSHIMGGKLEDGISDGILILKGLLKISQEVIPGSEGYDSTSDGILLEGISPGQGRPFSHV